MSPAGLLYNSDVILHHMTHLSPLEELISILNYLMSSTYQTNTMTTSEVSYNISPKSIRDTSIIVTPTNHILVKLMYTLFQHLE